MRNLFLICLLLFLMACKHDKTVNTPNKILFVCTNIDEVNERPNGTFLPEIAIPYQLLGKKGFEVDLLSPKGGALPIYHKFDTTEIIHQALENPKYQKAIANSLKPTEIDPSKYSAVIIPGGYGQFWDLHNNEKIQSIIASIYDSNGIVATIGHGAATLVNTKLKSGEYLVKGKTMTCFPNWNEKNIMDDSNFGELLPFLMEDELKKRGANVLVYDPDTKMNDEILDEENRLVTAAFSDGGEFVATQIIKLLNKN